MRYMIITYMARAQGRSRKMQQDEVVEVAKRLRTKDIDFGSVILDFQTRAVLKSSVGDQVAPRDFQKIRDYYYQHYRDIIDQLEKVNGEKSDNPS
jgi:hypothetical protein